MRTRPSRRHQPGTIARPALSAWWRPGGGSRLRSACSRPEQSWPFQPGLASASSFPSPVTGHVYLDDNTAGVNTISAFDRHANGSLTPMPGSPFAAGGAGTGAGLASQGAVQFADGGRFLLAADAGSNQVSVLRVLPGGSLHLASVVSSGGALPVSIAVHGSLVYVANAGPADSNYTGFRLTSWGSRPRCPGRRWPCPPPPSLVTCCSTRQVPS